jgi:hypothetical protein
MPSTPVPHGSYLSPGTTGEQAAGQGEPDELFWLSGEYLLTWLRGARLPALVTTSPPGNDRALAGVIGAPSTTVLFGDTRGAFGDVRSGLRIAAGLCFCPEHTLGVEGGFRFIESQATGLLATSDASPVLARPFTNAQTGEAQSVLIAFPGASTGSVEARASSGNFYDAWIDLSKTFYQEEGVRVDGLLGYRFLRFDEGLRVRQVISPTDPAFVAGTQVVSADDFGVRNEFHGIDVGLRGQWFFDDVSLSVLGKLATGNLSREARILGSQVTTAPGTQPVVRAGGVLALPSNSGAFLDRVWTIVPEVDATLRWQVARNLRVSVGYSVLVLVDGTRAADQVDLTLNPSLFPGAAPPPAGPVRPAFSLKQDAVWLQSVKFGAELSF